MKIGVLEFRYDHRKKPRPVEESINLGDNVQTLAVESLLRRLEVPPENIVRVNRDTLASSSGPPVSLILNGVLHRQSLPLPPQITPIFVGVHLENDIDAEPLLAWRSRQPIGCRDVATRDRLRSLGLSAYVSGCLSLSLPRRAKVPASRKVFIVHGSGPGAMPQRLLDAIPTPLRASAEIIVQRRSVFGLPLDDAGVRETDAIAQSLLDRYRDEATLVITPLLHAASPCVGLGIPVVLARSDDNERFTAIDRLLPLYLPQHFGDIDWDPTAVDVEHIKQEQTALVAALLEGRDATAHARALDDVFSQPPRALPAKTQSATATTTLTEISADSSHMFFKQDGKEDKASYSFYRGDRASFFPTDESLTSAQGLYEYFLRDVAPSEPVISEQSRIVAFGSCFASHISAYLQRIGFNVTSSGERLSYLTTMGEGIVNTFALRQQFEWAWNRKEPQVPLWYGYDARALGYDDAVREDTRQMFDAADVFIITLGLSEIWFDEPTGEVFWRAVPVQHFDPKRHKFRLATYEENVANLREIARLIRHFRPQAHVIFTLSPIPLKATFRAMPCPIADGVSKAILRAALDTVLREAKHAELHYFPSYDLALRAFEHPFMEDRRHVHKHVLETNMTLFERHYCRTSLTDVEVERRWQEARTLDRKVMFEGHWSVPRINLLFHAPPKP